MNILLLLVCLFLDSSFNSMHMLRFIIMYKIQSYISLVQCSGINLDFQLLFMKDSWALCLQMKLFCSSAIQLSVYKVVIEI